MAVLGLHDLDAFGDVSVGQRRGRVGELVGLDDPKRSNTRASGGQQQGSDGGGQRQEAGMGLIWFPPGSRPVGLHGAAAMAFLIDG